MEKAARSTPAAVEDRSSGWWFRHTDSQTWWAGAVLAHGVNQQIEDRVVLAERFYVDLDALARFQVCPACPEDLDAILAERGYRLEAPIVLLVAKGGTPTPGTAAAGVSVRVEESPTEGWVHVLKASHHKDAAEAERRMIARVRLSSAFVTAYHDGEPVGIGRAVADGDWTGVFHMVTVPHARGRGIARLVLHSISQWAQSSDAPKLYLQVERHNTIACRLYAGTGFEHLANYHYRVRAPLPDAR